ncbi:MAG: hypothetical protein AABZ65_01565 [Candidatus Omnitrophota bacterium]
MFKKVISLIVSCSLLLTQTVFSQGVAELNIGKYLSQMSSLNTDSFRPPHLRYVSYDIKSNDFKLLLDQGDFEKSPGHRVTKSPEKPENILKNETQNLFNYFLIGLSLPNDKFWVNLRPDAPEQIIDPLLEKTDMGRIMLEADLELKKDTASFTSPKTSEGKEYWDKLYKRAGELFGTENITIPTITRPWIVPGEVIIRESADSAYVYKANLKVMLEEDYLKSHQDTMSQGHQYNFNDQRLKELNEYSTQLIRELILPKLTKEVNTAKRYASLRQVFFSLILSRWFKDKFSEPVNGSAGTPANPYSQLIDSHNLTNLTSKEPWTKTTYFNEYKKSFEQGEYNLKEQVSIPTGQVIRSYVSGGIQPVPKIENMNRFTTSSPLDEDDLRGLNWIVLTVFVAAGALAYLRISEGPNKQTQPRSEITMKTDGMSYILDENYFTKDMKKTVKDILNEDKTTAAKAYAHLTTMAFSNNGAANMVDMIITVLNMPDSKITPEAYDALFFLFNKFPKGFGTAYTERWIHNTTNNLFKHIDIKYNSMNFKYFPVTFTFSVPDSFSEHALKALTDFLEKRVHGIGKRQYDDWHNHALTYFHNYSRNNKDRVSRKRANDPVYNAIVDLLKVTSKLGTGSSPVNSDELRSPGSSPLTPQEGASSAVVLEDEFKKVKDYAFNKFKSLEESLMLPIKGTTFARMMAARPNLRLGGPFTNNISQSKGFPGLMMSIESALQSAPGLFSGQVNLKQLGEIRQGLVDVIKPMGIQLQSELFEYINEYVLKNPAAASKLKAILQRPELNERIFDWLSPLKKNEVITAVTEDVIKAVDRQKASDFSERAEAWKALSEFVESSSALTQDLPQNIDLPLMPGGIDFTQINYLTRPMGSFQGLDLRLPLLSKAELEGIDINRELAAIEQMINAKIEVSTDRLKRLLAAMSQKDAFNSQRETQLLPLLLRLCWLKEERGVETTPDFRAVLLIADTGLFMEQGKGKYSLN